MKIWLITRRWTHTSSPQCKNPSPNKITATIYLTTLSPPFSHSPLYLSVLPIPSQSVNNISSTTHAHISFSLFGILYQSTLSPWTLTTLCFILISKDFESDFILWLPLHWKEVIPGNMYTSRGFEGKMLEWMSDVCEVREVVMKKNNFETRI